MPGQLAPNFGLTYKWPKGLFIAVEDWSADMDANLLKLSVAGVHLSVLDRDLTAPPATPADGDSYIPAAAATDAWVGKDGQIAVWLTDSWLFFPPGVGWIAYIADEEKLVVYKAAGWSAGIAL